ncbi:penicillin-binding protein [Patescibacteria group bacterium]|nr:penicillin-binding protein [Patescibacteria group bacterium]
MKKRGKKFFSSFKTLLGKHGLRNILLFLFSCGVIITSFLIIWVSTFKIPSLDTIEARKVSQSTKIYDNTGKILLFDVFNKARRTLVPFDQISPYIKEATISIEDKSFYSHSGVKPSSILRAILIDILTLNFTQGGSTITQQVVKKSILVDDKTPARKLKELVLALKLEKVLTKDQILSMYLNENPYGGSLYGVEEASQEFFGKPAKDVTIAEAAYLAALPQAPSYFSPYGTHRKDLDNRKNIVLREMRNDKKITEEEYQSAKKEVVQFLPKNLNSIKAPHFVMFIKDYLEKKYGVDVIEQGGLKVITTLNYPLQAKAEEVAKKYAEINTKSFNGTNDAFVAIDPKTGGILTMVGSRDYFDKIIDGNFNVTTAHRQPGSTFKPFVYAEAFIKGYTPETVLFDVPTQFSTNCAPDNETSANGCYSPGNYDDKFRGPMTLRNALAQSINVPSVKALYLAGVNDSINLAENMGIGSLGSASTYGLTLVLGGGEVSLLDMTSAYGVFADEGIRNPYTGILIVEDKNGKTLEELNLQPKQVMDAEVARKISDILNDNVARTPLYGANSSIYFPGHDVAVKTGTTNNYKDAWIIGYTPNIVVGTWAGNNNNAPMAKKVSGLIVAPMWRAFMDEVIKTIPNEPFIKPQSEDSYNLKPVLRGKWQGGISSISEGLQDPNALYDSSQEIFTGGVHSILYWVNKNDPRGPVPTNPENDPQFKNWEYSVVKWAQSQGIQ